MKKIVLSFALVMAAAAAFCQHSYLGIKGGANFSRFTVKDGEATDFRTGFHAGLLSHIHLNKEFALQPELLYSAQGDETKLIGNSTTIRRKLNYITIPVLLQYMFHNGFRLQAGPQVGFLLNAKSELAGITTNLKNSFESTDLGLAAGVGYLSPSGLGIDGRYVFGLSNIYKPGSPVIHSNVAQFGLFYMFHHTANKNIKHRN